MSGDQDGTFKLCFIQRPSELRRQCSKTSPRKNGLTHRLQPADFTGGGAGTAIAVIYPRAQS